MRLLTDSDRLDLTELETDSAAVQDFAGGAQAFLLLRGDGNHRTIEVPPGEELLVGRNKDCDVSLDDARASRAHASVFWDNGVLAVRDLGSRNGTLVNDMRLKEPSLARTLHAGDRIRVGSHELLVALVSPNDARDSEPPSDSTAKSELPSENVVIADPRMTRTYGFAHRIAGADTTVLVLGETGTGKEVLVQQIHKWSRRGRGPLVRINCAALPESLAESELFGHEKGAFTGAPQRKIGLAEAANGGTLFLDEMGELAAPVQAKLLMMLENKSIMRVGSTKETPVDLRVIAATHKDLATEVAEGRFREDLYYRIGVVILRVPPLRDRLGEVPLLAELFAKKLTANQGFSDEKVIISPAAMDALTSYPWPGNIRELRNAVEHAMLVSEDGRILFEHLPETITRPAGTTSPSTLGTPKIREKIAGVEQGAISQALRASGGNRTHAAMALGISLRSLLYKIKKYGIQD